MKDKLIFSILSVLVISAFTFGVTYAYFEARQQNEITVETEQGINTKLTLTEVKKATKLVPLNDNLVTTAISKTSDKCIDKSGYEVCSLYKITLENTSASESLYGYVRTDTSTYTTDNLKYQIFNSSFSALTDVMTLSKTADQTVYFKKDLTDYLVTSEGTTTYYMAIWLKDTGEMQTEDYSKTYSGYIGFESSIHTGLENGKIEAGFNS